MAAPVLESLSPSEGVAGSSDITMTITGTGFTPESVLVWNGADDTMEFVSETECTAVVKLSLSTVASVCTVAVRNDVDLSNELSFAITEDVAPPEPEPESASPNTNAVPATYMAPEPPDVYRQTGGS